MATPTVRRLQLGHELRHLREAAQLTIEDSAAFLERSSSTVSRIELGETGVKPRELDALLDFYNERLRELGREQADKEELNALAKNNEQRGRWSGHRSVYAAAFRRAVDLERDADLIRLYQSELVAGLLQTEEYMRALFTDSEARELDQSVKDAIRARLERQEVLTKEGAPSLGFVLSESAIQRVVGGRKVMAAQLDRLVEVAGLPNVQLQVIPFDARTPLAPIYNFTMYRVPSARSADPLKFIYIEEHTDGHYLDDPRDVNAYDDLWNRLVGAALDPVKSRALLRRTATAHRAAK